MKLKDLSPAERELAAKLALYLLRGAISIIASARAKGVDLDKLRSSLREENEVDIFEELEIEDTEE